jgi:hypothetical protein
MPTGLQSSAQVAHDSEGAQAPSPQLGAAQPGTGSPAHTLWWQRSLAVHGAPSSQSVSSGVNTQPSPATHWSWVQVFWSLHTIAGPTHAPLSHTPAPIQGSALAHAAPESGTWLHAAPSQRSSLQALPSSHAPTSSAPSQSSSTPLQLSAAPWWRFGSVLAQSR